MKQLRGNEKILLAVTLVLSFIFIFNLLIVRPLKENLSRAQQETDRSMVSFRKYSLLEKNRNDLLREYGRIEKYLAFKGSVNENTAAVLSSVETQARTAGLVILDMKPVVPAAGRPVRKSATLYPVQMTAEADLRTLIVFLRGLADAPILFNVEKLSVSIKDDTTGLLKIEAVIVGVCISQGGAAR